MSDPVDMANGTTILRERRAFSKLQYDMIGRETLGHIMLRELDETLSWRMRARPGLYLVGPLKEETHEEGAVGELATVVITLRRFVKRLPDGTTKIEALNGTLDEFVG